jgi:hypothetical protein
MLKEIHASEDIAAAVRFRKGETDDDKVIEIGRIATPPQINIAGNGGVFEFYVRNYSDEFVAEVTLPADARGQMTGTSELQRFKLAPGGFRGFFIPPFAPEQNTKNVKRRHKE